MIHCAEPPNVIYGVTTPFFCRDFSLDLTLVEEEEDPSFSSAQQAEKKSASFCSSSLDDAFFEDCVSVQASDWEQRSPENVRESQGRTAEVRKLYFRL